MVASVDSLLPWQTSSMAAGYVCSGVCTFTASQGALGYWPGLVFFIALIVGIVFFELRSLVACRLTQHPLKHLCRWQPEH